MITVIDYGAGNLFSVSSAIGRLGEKCLITSKKEDIERAEKIIFPGVGRAGRAMRELKKRGIADAIKAVKIPFLGICLGAQIMLDYSEEDSAECLGIIPGQVRLFNLPLKYAVPHMGWNNIAEKKDDPVLSGVSADNFLYFVHSYYMETADEFVIGKTEYGFPFVCAVRKKNFYGLQFHPEKSGRAGEKILENFIKL